MRIVALALLLTVHWQGTLEGRSAGKPPGPGGQRITFVEGSVSFLAPAGFTPLSPAEFAKFFPHNQGPPNAVGDSTRRTTFMYALEDGMSPSDNVEEGRKVFTEGFNQTFKNPKWFANAVRRVGERNWIVLEFAESASPTPMRHIVMASVHRKQVLVFNFRSTVKDFPSVESQLRAAAASITVKP